MNKNQWYRNLVKRVRGQAGVTLVEMVVSLCIFAIVSTLFTVAIVQYLHTTSADAIRSRSSTEIATSVRTLDRYVRNAVGVRDDGDAVTLVTYDADGVKQCAVIEYTEATWADGRVSDYGSVVVRIRPYDAGTGVWTKHTVLGSVMNAASASTSDDALFATKLLDVDSGTRVVRYTPVAGSYVNGKPVTSNASTSFTARNVDSSSAIDFSPCS